MPRTLRCAIVLVLIASSGCGKSSTGPPASPRPFRLGFTDFPSAATLEAVADAKRVIAADGDLIVYHLDGGIPWQEEAAGTPYHPRYESQLAEQAAFRPAGHGLFLVVNAVSFGRDGLAEHVGAGTQEHLTPPWDGLAFDDTMVVRVYRQYCERMIARFRPDWFGYALEANVVARKSPAQWPAFLVLAERVYVGLKRAHPALPVFATIQAENLYDDLANNGPATLQLLQFCDLVAVSTYPYVFYDHADQVPANYLSGLAALAPSKRFAISETGWPAEPVTAPYPVDRPGSPAAQDAWAKRLLADSESANGAFVSWFLGRDYDSLWVTHGQGTPSAPLVRLWRDIGLYDGAGAPRPALATWKGVQARPLR